MPVPTAYTEETLAIYMHEKLGNIAGVLGYSLDGGSYNEAIIDTLIAYGVTSIDNATNIKKLRALALVEAWKMAVADLSTRHDFSADGGSYNRSQMFENASKAMESAQVEALAYDTNYQVGRTRVINISDPYQVIPDEDRKL